MLNRWRNSGNSGWFYFGGAPKSLQMMIAALKLRCLLHGRKVITNLGSKLKSRDINWSTNVCLVKAMVFLVVMYGCEIWTIKKPECRRIYAFELWCWRRLLRVPWTARRSNGPILNKSVLGVHCKGSCWSWKLNILATWCEEMIHLKDPDIGKDWRQ